MWRNAVADSMFHSMLPRQVELYLGLLVMCGFVLYDTQLIIHKCCNGDRDYIWSVVPCLFALSVRFTAFLCTHACTSVCVCVPVWVFCAWCRDAMQGVCVCCHSLKCDCMAGKHPV